MYGLEQFKYSNMDQVRIGKENIPVYIAFNLNVIIVNIVLFKNTFRLLHLYKNSCSLQKYKLLLILNIFFTIQPTERFSD